MEPASGVGRVYTVPGLPPRPRDGHKGTFGRVLVVAGHPDMLGAPVLAGTAAYRSGCGYVQVATDRRLLPAALSVTPELVGLSLDPARDASLVAAAGLADALVVGPGMGTLPASRRRLRRLLRLDRPAVLDADALNLLAAGPRDVPLPTTAVLTPHPGEMARLARWMQLSDGDAATPAARRRLALRAAGRLGRVVVLKGAFTVVAAPPPEPRIYIEPSANTALSKAGTGDVLSGIIGSLLAQGMTAFDAAVLGVHVHALAGAIAREQFGERSPLARDIIAAIPQALCRLEPPDPSTA